MLRMQGKSGFGVREFAYGLIIVLFLGTSIWVLIEQSHLISVTLAFPYPLDYVESLSIDRALRVSDLPKLYQQSFSVAPFQLTPQPPLFYLLQAASVHAEPGFWQGRIISLISAISAAGCIALSVFGLTRDWLGAVVAGLLLWMYPQFALWGMISSPETLSLALSLAGLCATIWLGARNWGLALAMLLFVLSVASASGFQTAALAAACVWIAHTTHWRRAVAFALMVLVCCVGIGLLLNSMSGGGFGAHLLAGYARMFSQGRALTVTLNITLRSGFALICCLIFFILEPLDERYRATLTARIYLAVAFALMPLSGFEGGNLSAAHELIAAICVTFGVMIGWLTRSLWFKAGVIVLAIVQVNTLQEWGESAYLPNINRRLASRAELDALTRRFEDARGQVLADEYNGLLSIRGHAPYIYPYQFWQLQQAGLWSDQPLIDAIQNKRFALVAWYEPNAPDEAPYIVYRWSPAVRQAVYDNYVEAGYVGGTVLYEPR